MWLGILPDLPLFYLTCPVDQTLLGKTGPMFETIHLILNEQIFEHFDLLSIKTMIYCHYTDIIDKFAGSCSVQLFCSMSD